jgi:hypothetical protein
VEETRLTNTTSWSLHESHSEVRPSTVAWMKVLTSGAVRGKGRGEETGRETFARISSLMPGRWSLKRRRHSVRLKSKLISWSCAWPPPQLATLQTGGERG